MWSNINAMKVSKLLKYKIARNKLQRIIKCEKNVCNTNHKMCKSTKNCVKTCAVSPEWEKQRLLYWNCVQIYYKYKKY